MRYALHRTRTGTGQKAPSDDAGAFLCPLVDTHLFVDASWLRSRALIRNPDRPMLPFPRTDVCHGARPKPPKLARPRGLSFFQAIGTVDRSERYSGLRTSTPQSSPTGFAAKPPPLRDGGFFYALVNTHLVVAIVGTGEGLRPSDVAKTLQIGRDRVLGQRVDH
jgi:hypothetical protein